VAAPVVTYASAIALDELAISATAGAHSPSSLPPRESVSILRCSKYSIQVANYATMMQRFSMGQKGNCTFLGILGRHGEVFVVVVLALGK
jgi:hypothetical protein